MPKVTKAKEPTPKGGWLGPCTTGWSDLPERDKPAHLRPNYRPAYIDKIVNRKKPA